MFEKEMIRSDENHGYLISYHKIDEKINNLKGSTHAKLIG
jgi:hypothetical protein